MIKIFLPIVCLIVTATYAEKPNWYPNNLDEIAKKCLEENQLKSDYDKDLKYHQFEDNTQVHNLFLCKAKGMNIYKEDTGLNVDRLIYAFYKKEMDCMKPSVQDCVNKYKDLSSAGKMIYKVIYCIVEKEDELSTSDKFNKTDCSF
ncbi:hypothetical protein FF38_11674 [Lucilia cuprina]|uniref:Uncharacterized protein n=1 Tax=Lucilia cuprina TaxID=7375 RepID=A0A0L0CE66_LUCCU|nr:hypothetical protein CVS40_6249 [Lucilia cuprina]KNC30703.1 hypothetical protein FF38_11674 [Lucilia cuprina]